MKKLFESEHILRLLPLAFIGIFLLFFALLSSGIFSKPSVVTSQAQDAWRCPGNQCDRCGYQGWWASGCDVFCAANPGKAICTKIDGPLTPCGGFAKICNNSEEGTTSCITNQLWKCGNDNCYHPVEPISACNIAPTSPPPSPTSLTPTLLTPTGSSTAPNLNSTSQSKTLDPNDGVAIIGAITQLFIPFGNLASQPYPIATAPTAPINTAGVSPTISQNNGFVYYCQHNSSWKNICALGVAGCGPTSLAMIMSTLGVLITPPELDAIFNQNGWRQCGDFATSTLPLWTSWFTSQGFRAGPDLVSGGALNGVEAEKMLKSPSNRGYILASSWEFPCASCSTPRPLHHIFVVDEVDIQNGRVSIRDADNCSWTDGNIEIKDRWHNINEFTWRWAFPITKI